MAKRFVAIWFCSLPTDWFTLRQPELSNKAFVLSSPSHGRMIVTAVNTLAHKEGIQTGMAAADARVLYPALTVLDDKPGLTEILLKKIAEWCIRFTPFAAIDLPDGIILEATGCTHLFRGEENYCKEISQRLSNRGYKVRVAIADTIGCARAVARYGKGSFVVESGKTVETLLTLPAESLRFEEETIARLYKLGLRSIGSFMGMPKSVLRRRFGQQFIMRLQQAAGNEEEAIQPVQPIEPYHERLHSLEPINTATGIEIGLKRLLEVLCKRLQREQKGLRKAFFKCYRIDGKRIQIDIGTHRPSHHADHLFKLFEIKIPSIEPGLGIELFILEATKVEDLFPLQEKLWKATGCWGDTAIAELLDRLAIKIGVNNIHRYLPNEHYWPERSIKLAASLDDQVIAAWKVNRPRPLQLLEKPEPIMVTAPIPDYPPMLFRYKGKLHKIAKVDGPERIEQEWWLQKGDHRDYYYVEDEEGKRYWLFRSGHYSTKNFQWFIHGFFP